MEADLEPGCRVNNGTDTQIERTVALVGTKRELPQAQTGINAEENRANRSSFSKSAAARTSHSRYFAVGQVLRETRAEPFKLFSDDCLGLRTRLAVAHPRVKLFEMGTE
jgi:hypothetical protein